MFSLHLTKDNSTVSLPLIRRLALLISVCFCLMIIISFLIDFFTFPTVQTISLDRRKLASFPAVSVCNLNRIRRDNLCRSPDRQEWEELGLLELLKNRCSTDGNDIAARNDGNTSSQRKPISRQWVRTPKSKTEMSNSSSLTSNKLEPDEESQDEDSSSRVILPTESVPNDETTTIEPEVEEEIYRVKVSHVNFRNKVKKNRPTDEDSWKRDGMIGISPSKNLPGSYKMRFQKRSVSEEDNGKNGGDTTLTTKSQETIFAGHSISANLAQLLVIYNSLNESQKQRLGHSLEEMFLGCEFNGDVCAPEELSPFSQVTYGNCYTIDKSKTRAYAVGQTTGLKLDLSTESDQHTEFEEDALSAEGFRVVVHPANQPPDPATQGFDISPGFETSVAVSEELFERTRPPYADYCMFYGEGDLKNVYNRQVCMEKCMQHSFLNLCKCVSPYLESFGLGKACRVDDPVTATCLRDARECIYNHSSYCNCPAPCRETKYTISTSFSKLRGLNDQEEKSIARLRIYLSTMHRTVYQSVPKYRVHDLFTLLGGNFALWFGISVMTLVQLLSAYLERINNERQERSMQQWLREMNRKNGVTVGELGVTPSSIKCYDIT